MNDFRNALRDVTPTTKGKSLAQRRLNKILGADQLALIVTNRQARVGMKPKSISRQLDWLDNRVTPLGHLDRLLDCGRRNPRKA